MDEHNWLAPKEPVWILKNGSFIRAIVESANNEIVICLLEDGSYAQAKKNVLFQRNPIYKEFNPERWDLMDTDLLNQPEVLKTLKFRLQNSRIYTFVENSIISVNPYTQIHALYLDQLKDFYIQNIIKASQNSRDFEPHIYSVTSQMISCLQKNREDQAVIISGESGAGKTEANKQCLRFLLYYFHNSSTSMDQKINNILSLSNPVLQAFGNSKTIRNNNSSRFGKYLNISLNQKFEIKDVKIFNYLLEKSRIIGRAENQQNFHIFYELLKGLTQQEKAKYYLCNNNGKEYKMEDFNYLRSKTATKYEQHPDISFEEVKKSIITLEKEDSFDLVCRVLASILLLGNLIPFESENEDCCQISNDEILQHICILLQIKKSVLSNALTCYPIKIGSEILTKYFNAREVQQLINSFAKILYERLFQWIINQINSLSKRPAQETDFMHLGFLDIYGFQILEQNSLQQLFINYTNERLHQIYLTKIFKDQELLFKKEGLTHKFKGIPYEDNLPVLELIDYEQLSILNLLDQWCSVASPDDSSFITKLRHKHKKHSKFPPSNFNLPSTMFLIRHSPKDIQYTVIGFRDKNRDLVREEIKAAVRTSQLSHLSSMFSENSEGSDASMKQNHKFRKFLSTKFRYQISNLVTDLIGKSNLHFIRCVKSNEQKKPLFMDDEVVYNQISYLGILDTIKLKKIGYCVKVSYSNIDKRFKWLVRRYYSMQAMPKDIMLSLKQFLPRYGQEDILFGESLVFFKDYAFSTMNKKYNSYLQDFNDKCSRLQRSILGFLFSRKMGRIKQGSKTIKSYLKTMLTSRNYAKTLKGLIVIQRLTKTKLKMLRKQKRIKNILILQAYIKKTVCKKKKEKVFIALQKIIGMIKRYQLRKNVQKYAIINQVKNYIVEKTWKKIVIANKNIIQTYLKGFVIQLQQRMQIGTANYNTHKKFQAKYVQTVQQYIRGFSQALTQEKLINKVTFTQRFLITWLYRQRFVKLRKAAITIQRAYRQYYFNKNTARHLFQLNFGQYHQRLNSQNESIRNVLFQNSLQNSLLLLYHNHLSKFRQKCTIFYIVIDFEAFIGLELCYPQNSWLLNYFQVVKQTLDKESPIQTLEVGESFSVAASTNRLYVWGIGHQYNSHHNIVLIKPNGTSRLQKAKIINNSLGIIYKQSEQSKNKEQIKSYNTVSKEYIVENGKLFQCRGGVALQLIKLPQINQRVAEVACGSNHTIFRTTAKKVYTFGSGKMGQLGHNCLHNSEQPKLLEFNDLKNYAPLQVSASFNSSLLLLANRKLYWWGTNGSIDKVKSPTGINLNKKLQELGNGAFAPLRIKTSWSRTMSVIGLTFLHFNGKLSNNIGLRNKVYDLIVNKWQEHDIETINPPFSTSYSDYLQECHVKLPKNKVVIEPESKRALKKLEEKVSLIQNDKQNQFSFFDSSK